MKIAVIGTRGFPGIQGGVEKHCEALYPLLAKGGRDIVVFRRKPYLTRQSSESHFDNIRFIDLWCPARQSLEAVIHSFSSALICLFLRPDIVHIHNIGPALVLPLLKVGGLSTVVTYHSPNYEHSKWNWFAKKMLSLGEYFTKRFADWVIFVSHHKSMDLNCRNKTCIPNGVVLPIQSKRVDFLKRKKIIPRKYILGVGRLAPEKGFDVLITAFKNIDLCCQLVIAGDADHETEYSRKLKQIAAADERIVLTGYITGEDLNQIFSNARLFVLPSYHEGLPIALLEALSYNLSVLVSEIPANLEVGLSPERYFAPGNIDQLREKIETLLPSTISDDEENWIRTQLQEKYNWDKVAKETISVYKKALNC